MKLPSSLNGSNRDHSMSIRLYEPSHFITKNGSQITDKLSRWNGNYFLYVIIFGIITRGKGCVDDTAHKRKIIANKH